VEHNLPKFAIMCADTVWIDNCSRCSGYFIAVDFVA